MFKGLHYRISELLNDEMLQNNQQKNFIIAFRTLQLAQYLSLAVDSPYNIKDNFHFNTLSTICRVTLLDFDKIPSYIGYFSCIVTFYNLFYFLLLNCFNLNKFHLAKLLAMVYSSTLPQLLSLLQISISVNALMTNQNIFFEQLLGILTIIGIFIQSFISQLFLRNTYLAQTFLCRDLTILGLSTILLQFLTILFHFYDTSNSFKILTLIFALLWAIAEYLDIWFNCPYSMMDNLIQIDFCAVKLIFVILSILNHFLKFQDAVVIYGLILGIIGYWTSRTVFRTKIYNQFFHFTFDKVNSSYQIFYLKILLFIKYQLLFGEQKFIFLSQKILILHQKSCTLKCEAQVFDNILECVVSRIFEKEEENQFLYKITFMAFYKKQYSLSLMKIKQFQIHNPYAQSWYFKLMVMNISENIEKEIQMILYNQTSQDNLSKYTFLTSKDLVEFEQQEIELLPIITQLIVVKIDIWQSQIRGFHDIYRLQEKLVVFSTIIEKIREKITIIFDRDISDITISLLNNMYQLRILSLYFSVIMNDQLNSYLCEKQIQIVYYFEQTLKQNELTSLALITDKISVISVSMVKKQGEILNQNKQKIGNLFGYHKSSEYNAILSVNQIIPDFISVIHNEMLTEFLKKGQSSFFVAFKTVFGKNKSYDIVPLQLKFSNDFSYLDDFVIKGVMYQGQKQQDFIIFDDLGHIQGITKAFFDNIIKDNHKASKIDCETVTKQMYIYYFMPEIFRIVIEFQKLKNHSQQIQFLEDTEFMVLSNLIEFHDDFSRSARKFTKHTMSDQVGLLASSYTNCSELTNNNLKSVMRRRMFAEIDRNLLNEEFAKSAIKFINNNADNFMTFFIKFQLSYYPIRNEKVKGFYILEILDYRKNYDKKVGSEIVCKDLDSTMRQSIKIQSQFMQRVEIKSDTDEINNICQIKSNTNTTENLRLETNANSSKRVIFLKPEIECNINDFIGEVQSESESDDKQIDYFSPPQSRRLQFCKENDSIHQEGVKNQKQNISEMEMAINQSQSSAVSRQSSRSSNYFYNLFQKKTNYAQNIKFIIFLCFLTIMVNLFLCIFTSARIYSSQQIQEQLTSTMKIPMNLNRYFTKTATLSWISLCSYYEILDISQFQKNQNLYQLSLIDQYMLGNISLIYPSLIETEDIIPLINQQQGLYNPQEVKLTQFINYMSLFTKQILTNKAEINRKYIDAMIILRYNIKNMHSITAYLMEQLITEYENEESLIELNQLVSIVINSILIFILFTLQLVYYIKIQIQNKSLTLLVGRVKEQELFAEIIKTQYLLSSLKNIAGEDSWKRVNFWSFIFQNDYEQHYKQKQNQQKTNQKSNLNSRIKHLRIHYELQAIKILIQFLIYLSFIWGAYFFFENQNQSVSPLVDLDSKYVQFSVNIDVLVFSGLVIKSQQQLYEKLINDKIYNTQQIKDFDDGNEILKIFASLQNTFSLTMKSLFNDVISTLPNNEDAQNMKNLIDQDICLTLYNQIPFCQYKNQTNQQFINQYGEYFPYDNDLDYLKAGILGIAAKQSSFYQQNYGLEIDSLQFNTNQQEIQAVYKTLEFNNIILSHFKDSYLTFVRFLELLNTNISNIRNTNFLYLMLYIYVIGISYFIIFIIYHYFWIMKTNDFIRLLKLSLVVMPNELLSNSSIINNLRKIN